MTRLCLVNLAHLDPANNGGVSQLARVVARALASPSADLHVVFIVRARFAAQFQRWLGVRGSLWVIPYSRFLPAKLLIKLLRPSVIVSPLFGIEPFVDSGTSVHVVSIPDTLALDHPELFSEELLQQRRLVYERAASARTIITLSNFACQRLHDHFPTLSTKIEVVGLGSDQLTEQDGASPTNAPYIFYPANTWKHKQHKLLLQTMQRIWRVRPDIKLVLSGGRPPDVDLQVLIAQYAPAGAVIDLGYVSDAQLAAAYRHAEAMLFTSQYEGFGIPLLEAMHAGCPVICTSVTAVPEIAGDAAIYVRSDDPDDWASAFFERLPPQKDTLIARGYDRAARFTWAETRDQWMRLVLSAAYSASAI